MTDDAGMDTTRRHVAAPAEKAEPIPIGTQVPPGYWRKDDTHLLWPPTPMTESVAQIDAAFGQACADFELLAQPKLASIGGWQYVSMHPVGGKPDAPAPPGRMLPLVLRLSPDAHPHRIPAVVVTRYTTNSLRDGQIITVDGTRGIEEIGT